METQTPEEILKLSKQANDNRIEEHKCESGIWYKMEIPDGFECMEIIGKYTTILKMKDTEDITESTGGELIKFRDEVLEKYITEPKFGDELKFESVPKNDRVELFFMIIDKIGTSNRKISEYRKFRDEPGGADGGKPSGNNEHPTVRDNP